MSRPIELATLTFATLLTGVALLAVPSWRGALLELCHLAAIAGAVTLALLWVTRRAGRRGIASERLWMALFLAGMPAVYVASWFATSGGGAPRGWLWVELAGLPLYAGLAWLGLQRSPWFLVAGMAGHGIAWDAWHLVKSDYIPSWYAIDCLLVDVGMSAYLATRVPAWRAWQQGRRAALAGEADSIAR